MNIYPYLTTLLLGSSIFLTGCFQTGKTSSVTPQVTASSEVSQENSSQTTTLITPETESLFRQAVAEGSIIDTPVSRLLATMETEAQEQLRTQGVLTVGIDDDPFERLTLVYQPEKGYLTLSIHNDELTVVGVILTEIYRIDPTEELVTQEPVLLGTTLAQVSLDNTDAEFLYVPAEQTTADLQAKNLVYTFYAGKEKDLRPFVKKQISLQNILEQNFSGVRSVLAPTPALLEDMLEEPSESLAVIGLGVSVQEDS